MYHDLTKGSILTLPSFICLPMMAGNLLQQFYNIADTLIVGRVLGKNALAAVGSSYTLMTIYLDPRSSGGSAWAPAHCFPFTGEKEMRGH